MTNEIEFLSYYPEWLMHESPRQTVRSLPEWYRSLDKYTDGHPQLKACVPFFDAMTAGYVLTTPCDIEFYKNGDRISARVSDENHKDFINERSAQHIMPFPEVHGYSMDHFDWWPLWGEVLPEGYSALYIHPLNRYDLPFMTTNGIVDNDKFGAPGRLPFFLKEGFEGILPAGTPVIQIIPFKREDWSMKITQLSADEVNVRIADGIKEYRDIGHSGYRKNKWSPKHFN